MLSKNFSILISFFLLFSFNSFAQKIDNNTYNNTYSSIVKALTEKVPNLPKIDEIQTSPVPGIYEVRHSGTEIFYTTIDGNYIFNIRTASQASNKTMSIEFDGVDAVGTITMPNTGGWQKWATYATTNIGLTAGIKKMRLKFTTGSYNLNYIEVITNPVSTITEFNTTENANLIYPNPFTENSTLKFNLKNSGLTKISIVDAVGKEQKILHHDFINAGKQTFLLNGLALPKGSYHCIIQSEEERITLKFATF